uniref:Uncharacterized protein n=1 Tax=viral metagenome TaxID=1070528 RepID=A0A6C0LRU6_9ZZZZ
MNINTIFLIAYTSFIVGSYFLYISKFDKNEQKIYDRITEFQLYLMIGYYYIFYSFYLLQLFLEMKKY